jgi:uncharacterized protein (DUF362 family)
LQTGINRREFLTRGSVLAASVAIGGRALAAPDGPTVGVVRSDRVLRDNALDADLMGRMVDRAVVLATGAKSADKAWESLFSSDETVGIKPNGLGGMGCSTAPELVAHCVQRLQAVGVKPDKIIFWEWEPVQLEACGVPLDDIPWGVRAYLTRDHMGDTVTNGRFRDTVFAPLLTEVDAVLNLPILKCHPICGVTLAMKNHYGSIGHPADQHFEQCHPSIVGLSGVEAIRKRTRLIVTDCTRALLDGQAYGEPQWFPGAVMAATDPVAHDATGWRMLEAERHRRGMPSFAQAGLEPKYIMMAQEAGLGIADEARIAVKAEGL